MAWEHQASPLAADTKTLQCSCPICWYSVGTFDGHAGLPLAGWPGKSQQALWQQIKGSVINGTHYASIWEVLLKAMKRCTFLGGLGTPSRPSGSAAGLGPAILCRGPSEGPLLCLFLLLLLLSPLMLVSGSGDGERSGEEPNRHSWAARDKPPTLAHQRRSANAQRRATWVNRRMAASSLDWKTGSGRNLRLTDLQNTLSALEILSEVAISAKGQQIW